MTEGGGRTRDGDGASRRSAPLPPSSRSPSPLPLMGVEREVRVETWADVLRAALSTVLGGDEFDITAGAEPGVLEVAADDWTLRVEGLPGGPEDDPPSSLPPPPSPAKRPTAWVAIDDEPDTPARYRAARRAAMSPALDRALAQADVAMDGALLAALEAGEDPFSQDLVEGMRELGGEATRAGR